MPMEPLLADDGGDPMPMPETEPTPFMVRDGRRTCAVPTVEGGQPHPAPFANKRSSSLIGDAFCLPPARALRVGEKCDVGDVEGAAPERAPFREALVAPLELARADGAAGALPAPPLLGV